jgi:hypothetical protein
MKAQGGTVGLGVHRDDGFGFVSLDQAAGNRRQFLQLSNSRVNALDDSFRLELGLQRRKHSFAQFGTVHRLDEHLEGKHVVVSVNDESRQPVGFAEDQAIRVALFGNPQPFAIGDRSAQAVSDKLRKVRLAQLLRAEQAQGDLGTRTRKRGAKEFVALVANMN